MADVRVYSLPELRTLAERQAKNMLGVDLATAFEMLDEGKLHGTLAESELKCLRFLLERA